MLIFRKIQDCVANDESAVRFQTEFIKQLFLTLFKMDDGICCLLCVTPLTLVTIKLYIITSCGARKASKLREHVKSGIIKNGRGGTGK